ncbi:hypothetical protein [Ochrobactrum sp. AP1BH01-1]|nr:hypothetical protein [Ochrobactrum sp. AP1BH01-1]
MSRAGTDSSEPLPAGYLADRIGDRAILLAGAAVRHRDRGIDHGM